MMCVDRIVNTALAYSRVSSDCIDPYNGFPCGQCANCRARNTNKWVARLMHQASISKYVVSFCLTYTVNMLMSPRFGASMYEYVDVVAPDGVVVKGMDIKRQDMGDVYLRLATLSKNDVQKFIKRLRSNKLKFKYYVKGEYGSAHHHPHFHVLCFVDVSETATEYEFRLAVLRAWYNGIYKLDSESRPNMGRRENIGKEVKVNPIVSFGTFDEDCAKYCTKYVSKESLLDCEPSHLIPEFTLNSNGMAVDFYEEQMEKKRFQFLQLVDEYNNETISRDDFKHRFKRIMTFTSNENKDVFFPSFLRSTFFKGYFVYCKKFGDKKQISSRDWHTKGNDELIEVYRESDGLVCEEYLGKFLSECYSQMLHDYVNIMRADYFGLDDDVIFVDSDLVASSMHLVQKKMEKDLQSNKNRVAGAYASRQRKIQKNSVYG